MLGRGVGIGVQVGSSPRMNRCGRGPGKKTWGLFDRDCLSIAKGVPGAPSHCCCPDRSSLLG
jgi:hypothetical protein